MREGTIIQNSGYKSYYCTGSDEAPAMCLEDGIQAATSYGVSTYTYGGNCLHCNSSIQVVLDFNPVDCGHYYARCPICNVVWRHLNPDGSLSDFKIIVLPKNPALERDYNDGWENNGWL